MTAFRPADRPMIAFHVRGMACARSARSIARAVKAVDGGARVRIDMAARQVEIEPIRAEVHEFTDAINKAGYTQVRRWPSELLL